MASLALKHFQWYGQKILFGYLPRSGRRLDSGIHAIQGLILHMVLSVLLLAQLQTLVPLERRETAADQIRQLCPIASPRDRDRLVGLERRLGDSVSAAHASPDIWRSLGCVRALLALNASLDDDGIRKPIDESRARDAIGVLFKALDRRPGDTVAAELLAALSQQATAGASDAKAMLLDDLAVQVYNAVRAGVTSPAVLRACSRLLISVGDIATARDCSNRAMQSGSDSTWHLLRLAQVNLADGNIPGATALFERAAMSAHDSVSMNELLYPFFTEANWARWIAVADSARPSWLRDSLFPNKIYQSATWADRLALQLAGGRVGGGRSLYWWCGSELPAECALPSPKGETVIRTAARFNQVWDVATGEPIALIAFGVRVGDLTSRKDSAGRLADLDLTIHTWDEVAHRWSDTTIRRQLRYPASVSPDAFATGRVMIPASPGVTSWAIKVAQPEGRRGRAADDQHAPIGPGPLRLSDLLIRVVPADSAGMEKEAEPALAPFGHVGRAQTAQLFFQLWSQQDYPRLKWVVALRRLSEGAVEEVPTMQFAWDGVSKRGLTELSRTFSASHLLPGSYRIHVLVMDEISGAMVRRETALLVD